MKKKARRHGGTKARRKCQKAHGDIVFPFVPSCLRASVPISSGLLSLFLSATASAITEDEVLKSINENVGARADPAKLIPWVCGAAVVIFLIVVYNKWQSRRVVPRVLNNDAKLMRDVLKQLPLRKTPVKNLKLLAEQQGCSSPLTLLICPSLLASAAKRVKIPEGSKGEAVAHDRDALMELARELEVKGQDNS